MNEISKRMQEIVFKMDQYNEIPSGESFLNYFDNIKLPELWKGKPKTIKK